MILNRHWIAVISKDHVVNGVSGGFIQVCHGKQAPLKRLHQSDWVMIYSPKLTMGNSKMPGFYGDWAGSR